MVEKAVLIDVSKCMACRGCQVACKQWNNLPGEKTTCRGTYQNPADLSPITWTLVRFTEVSDNGDLKWLFRKDQCRHCDPPPCKEAARVPGSIIRDKSGAVVFTEKTTGENFTDILSACPFNVPRYDYRTGKIQKCHFCIDRITNGLSPACVKACPTGALQFGDKTEIMRLAREREKALKPMYKNVVIYPGEDFHMIWVLPEGEKRYQIAKNPKAPSNTVTLRSLFKPFGFLGLGAALLSYLAVKGEPPDKV